MHQNRYLGMQVFKIRWYAYLSGFITHFLFEPQASGLGDYSYIQAYDIILYN